MKKRRPEQSLLAIALIVLMLLCVGCTKKTDEGKIPITTSSDEARREFLQGRDLFDRLLLQSSIQRFENAVAKDTNFALAYLNLAQVSPTAKRFFENLKKSVALADKVTEGERLLILGFEAGVNGDPTKQKEYYDKLVVLYPGDERAHFAIGNYFVGQQEYGRAVEHYKKATEIDSNFSPAYNSLGYAYRPMNNYAGAEKAFKKYTELIPNDPNPYDSHAELLMKMGRFEESITYYEKALSQDPHFIGSHLGIAANLMFVGKPEDAVARLQKLYDMARDEGEQRTALFTKAVHYVDGGKMDLALQEMDKQHAMAEKIHDVAQMSGDLATKAAIVLEMGRYDDALGMFEKSTTLIDESDLSQAIKDNVRLVHHYNVATVAMKKKDFKTSKAEAEEFAKGAEAMQSQTLIRQSHELDGMIALEEKQYDKALAELQQASQLNPYNLYRISLAYAGKGDKASAKDFCMKAARDNTLPTLNYAFIRFKAEKMLTKM
jgi:tetratricopeptide (TPR) repeat protein